MENSFDVLKATYWKKKVIQELADVETDLNRVYQCVNTMPDDDDTVFKGIRKLADKMNESWTTLNNAFKEVGEITEQIIQYQSSGIDNAYDRVMQMLRKL